MREILIPTMIMIADEVFVDADERKHVCIMY